MYSVRITLLRWLAPLALGGAALAGCASVDTQQPRQQFNEADGSSLTIVRAPLVFARARTDVAAHTHDYVTIVAVQEDRSGQRRNWLVAYRWSTVDPRISAASSAPVVLRLIADDRTFDLMPDDEPPSEWLHRSDLFAPHPATPVVAFAVDTGALRYSASARQLSLRIENDALPVPYSLWEDGRPALQAWLSVCAPNGTTP